MINSTNNPELIKARGFHPKRLLKDLQQRLYSSQYLYLLFCFLAPIAIMYLLYGIFWIAFGADGTPLVLDLNSQYVYFFEALRKFVYGEGSLLYSFARSLGGEFMGIYAYYMASPLTYIVALFPQTRIQEAVLCILLLKTGLSGLSFGYYLHKRTRKPNKMAIFIFSLLYSLSAYAIVQQNNTMWIDALIWLPIFAYALEELISKRRFKLYVISLTVILVSNYYIGYMVCIFAVLYFFYCYFSKAREEINPLGEKLHFVRTGARFAAFSLLSAAMSAFMLIAAYYSLGFGKTEFSSPNWALKAKFDILDFLSKFLPGAYDTVEPSGLPFVYCGILALILLPVYFTAKKVSNREKIASASLLAVFLISFIVNPIDLIWHGFSVPNWLNGRYSFLFCFVLLVIAYKGFGNLRRISDKMILAICGFLLLFVAVAEKFELKSFITSDEKLLTLGCIWFSVFFIVAIGVLLCLMINTKSKKTFTSVTAVLAAVVCVELICNGVVCMAQFNDDVHYARYSDYQQNLAELREVIDQVKENDKGFYRMDKTKHRTRNDNMALGINGLTNSTSTLNSSAIKLVSQMGYLGRAHLTMYRGGTPFSDSIFGIKYVADYKSSERFANVYDLLEDIQGEKYYVYQNPYAMSLAFGVNDDVNDLDLEESSTVFNRYNALITAMLGEEERIALFKPVNSMTSLPSNCEASETTLSSKYTTEERRPGSVTLIYDAPYTGNYYFYAPGSATEEVEVEFNGSLAGDYLGPDTNHILFAGYYNEGDEIEVKISIPKDSSLTLQSQLKFLWYLDDEIYDECMTALLNGPQYKIDEDYEDHHLTGTISTASADSMILTTIPYDEGWKVYVDGTQVEIYETLDALMAFDITEAGVHSLEMRYMPDCYKLGITVSAVAIGIFILLCSAELVLRRTLLKNRIPTYPEEYWTLDELTVDDKLIDTLSAPAEKVDASDSEQPAVQEASPAEDAESPISSEESDNS